MAVRLGNNDLTASFIGTNVVTKMYLGTDKVYDIFVSASGGSTDTFVSGSDTYRYHQYTGSGNFTIINPGKSYTNTNTINVVVVGGGGGGNNSANMKGAGGGGFVSQSFLLTETGSFNIVVGNGGAYLGNGSQSSFTSGSINLIASGGFSNGYSGEPNSHNPGTDITNCYTFFYAGGGGGGSYLTGSNAQCANFGYTNGAAGGAGGNGVYTAIRGEALAIDSLYFGGGGGGGSLQDPAGASGGYGGGGVGRRTQVGQFWQGTSGAPNTGGGAGGTDAAQLTGGSGTVIINYRIS